MVKSLIVCLIAVLDPDLAIRGVGGGGAVAQQNFLSPSGLTLV